MPWYFYHGLYIGTSANVPYKTTVTRPMGQDTAKSTEWVHGEDWSDCTDTQVDENLRLFFAYYFCKFHAFQSNNNNNDE